MKIGDRIGTTALIRTCSGVPQLARVIWIRLEILERIAAVMDDRLAFCRRPSSARAGHVDALIDRGQVLLDRALSSVVQGDYPDAGLNEG